MTKKAHDLRDMGVEDLESLATEKSEELMTQRMRLKLRQLDNPLAVRNIRRELATIKTILNEKRRAVAR
jgi:large subunit ribosomal protein L29